MGQFQAGRHEGVLREGRSGFCEGEQWGVLTRE